jgi:hypothetical protein
LSQSKPLANCQTVRYDSIQDDPEAMYYKSRAPAASVGEEHLQVLSIDVFRHSCQVQWRQEHVPQLHNVGVPATAATTLCQQFSLLQGTEKPQSHDSVAVLDDTPAADTCSAVVRKQALRLALVPVCKLSLSASAVHAEHNLCCCLVWDIIYLTSASREKQLHMLSNHNQHVQHMLRWQLAAYLLLVLSGWAAAAACCCF